MTQATVPSNYPIEPLLAWLQAGVPLVTPNLRLARQIKMAFAQHQLEQGKGAWPTPAVYSLEHWLLHCLEQLDPWQESALTPASDAQQLQLWQQCITSNPESAALLRPWATATLARDAYRSLQLWEQDWRRAPLAEQLRSQADTALFSQWATEYERQLTELGLATLPQLLATVTLPPVAELVLVEFNELAPLYERLLEAQAETVRHFHQQGQARQMHLQPCEGAQQELQLAAQWVCTQWQEDSQRRIAILLPEVQLQRQALRRYLCDAFDLPLSAAAELPVNFSGGSPLADAVPVRDALQLLGLLQGDIEVEDLVVLLQSPFYRRDEAGAVAVIRSLYRHGRATISGAQCRYLCRELPLGQALLRLYNQRELRSRQRLGEWIGLIKAVLEELGWPGAGPLDSQEYQQVEQFYGVLEGLSELDRATGKVDLAAALSLLRWALTNRVFQRQTAAASIQVLGLLEAAGLTFDAIWMVGMGATQWPAPARPNPFLPTSLQRELAMPHADAIREHDFAAQLLQQFERCCSAIVASYVAQEGGVELRPSALLAHFEKLPLQPVELTPGSWRIAAAATLEEAPTEVQAPVVTAAELERIKGGTMLVSDQSQCPFRAFSQHRLKVRATDKLSVGLTASDRGSLLHDALFRLWGELGDSEQLRVRSPERLNECCEAACKGAVDDFARRNETLGRQYLKLEQQRLCELLQQWLQVEARRPPFAVAARELPVELQLGPLQLRFRIDRVDQLADGSSLVLDYKSSDNKLGDWFTQRPRQPQIPLYVMALPARVSGAAFAMPLPEKPLFRGLQEDQAEPFLGADLDKLVEKLESKPADWQELVGYWSANLQQLADNFLAGDAAVDPLNVQDSCRYCGLQALCRIGERAADV